MIFQLYFFKDQDFNQKPLFNFFSQNRLTYPFNKVQRLQEKL